MDYKTYETKRAELIAKLAERGMSAPAKRFPKMARTMRFDSGETWAHAEQIEMMRELLRDLGGK